MPACKAGSELPNSSSGGDLGEELPMAFLTVRQEQMPQVCISIMRANLVAKFHTANPLNVLDGCLQTVSSHAAVQPSCAGGGPVV